MSISTISPMDKSPQPLALPGVISLTQTWESDQASGEIGCATFILVSGNDIWFNDNGSQVKSIQFDMDVEFESTTITHLLMLERNSGNQSSARITQEVTSNFGHITRTRNYWVIF